MLAGCEVTATVGDRVVHVLLYGEGLLEPDLADAVEVPAGAGTSATRPSASGWSASAGSATPTPPRSPGPAPCRGPTSPGRWSPGVVADVAEAFDRYLSSGRPAYVPAPGVSVTDAVAIAAKAGGVAVLAHPGRLADGERDRVLDEAHRGRGRRDRGLALPARRRPAPVPGRPGRARGLLATGGSDYHGRHKPDVRVGTGKHGNVTVPAELLDVLRDRLAPAVLDE